MKKEVLVVDKDKNVADSLSDLLQDVGYCVDIAKTGRESIKKALAKRYDAILMDLDPVDMDRDELLQKMCDTAPESVLVLMACFPYWQQGTDSINFRQYECLLKPFSPEILLAALKKKNR